MSLLTRETEIVMYLSRKTMNIRIKPTAEENL